ncbi:PAS domain-containing protein, partial [Klebsiella pneumoniae]|nr:PAS domain-containing protein [Klebsiella pneumoniae]
ARPDGFIDYYSQRWYDFLGGTQKELIGWRWEDYIHPDDLQATIDTWRECLQNEKNFSMENRWFSVNDGSYRWFLVRAIPMRDQ